MITRAIALLRLARRTLRPLLARAGAVAESVRAHPQLRERAAAGVAFTAIFVFALASVDFLISGGPDWTPGAAASTQTYVAAAPAPVRIGRVEAPAPTTRVVEVADVANLELEDYSVATEDLLGGPDTVLPGWRAAAERKFETERDPFAPAILYKPEPAGIRYKPGPTAD